MSTVPPPPPPAYPALPYRVATLCFLFDHEDRTLLLHRAKSPNRDLYSPIGGKLEQQRGESPTACAVREIGEETGLSVAPHDLHLTGIVSETAYENENHWLMFLYELIHPVNPHQVHHDEFDEGKLEWHTAGHLKNLPLPPADREVIWPLFHAYRGGFFAAHIDCHTDPLTWHLEQGAEKG